MENSNTIPILCLAGAALIVVAGVVSKRGRPPRPPSGGGAATASDWPWVVPRLLMTLGVAGCGLALALLGIRFYGLILAVIIFAVVKGRRWRGSGTSGGTARWADDADMARAGMFSGFGLLIGWTYSTGRRGSWTRSVNRLFLLPWSKSREACLEFAALYGRVGTGAGRLVRLPSYTHVLLVGGTGSGKGVSVIIPQLLSYYSGSVVCFDTKGDLAKTTAPRRAERGERIVVLSPFGAGTHTWNPLDSVRPGPLLVDDARSVAEALVVRAEGGDRDPHWNASAVMVICAAIVFVCLTFKGKERSLNAVRDIVSDPDMVIGVSVKLQEARGVPGRMGSQLKFLYERVQKPDGKTALVLSKEGSSVLSTVGRHLSFLDSELVEKCLAVSTFDPEWLLKPGTTVYLQVPPDQLAAQQGLIRLWVSSLVRYVGQNGNEDKGEVLCLLDEASSLNGLAPLQEALVRGRSAGVRLLLAYQGDSQVKSAFKDEPSLLYENCAVQLYPGGASSLETAQRLEAMLGEYTNVLENYQAGTSLSHPTGATHHGGGGQASSSTNRSYSEAPRKLLKAEEILRLDKSLLIAFTPDTPPLILKRLLSYSDSIFAGGRGKEGGGAMSKAWALAFFWLLAGAVSVATAVAVLGSLDHVR